MTKYLKLMKKARRKNYMHADAEMVGHLLGQRDDSIDKGLRHILFGPEFANHRGDGIGTVLWHAIHQEDWSLVAEALDTVQTLRRAYDNATFKRKHGNKPAVIPPPVPPGKYLQ